MTVSVLVTSKRGQVPTGLHRLPFPHEVFTNTEPGWAKSANKLLDQAARLGNDAIFVDDDVEILDNTFSKLDKYLPTADVFGFRLVDQGGRDQHVGWGLLKQNPQPDRACYLSHVTASLLYLKASVLQKIRFPVWPGIHSEDMAFTYDCWMNGFKVAYIPNKAIHIGTATKRNVPAFEINVSTNRQLLIEWVKARRPQFHLVPVHPKFYDNGI